MIKREFLPEETRMMFNIAEHGMEVVMPATVDWEQLLPAFKDFRCDASAGEDVICSIRIVEDRIDGKPESMTVLKEESGILGHWFCLMESKQHYVVDIQFVENGNIYRMITGKSFEAATAYVDCKDENASVILSMFLMIAFGQSAVLHDTVLIHASAVENDGNGYLFLGKSGTGKSTHSSLWMRYVEGTELLNDDNPAIRITKDGIAYVYGTPWSGKTPCYRNRRATLKALVRLEQAPANRFRWKTGVEALITLLPGCLSMRWNELLYNRMCSLLEKVIDKVKVGWLECLPDQEAALVCYKQVKEL